MVLAKYVRLVLLGTALVASQAQASFDFNSCVESCIHSSGCSTSDERCMCREARDLLMESVVSCLYFNCKSDLRDFEDAFLEPIEEGCEDIDREIPSSKLRAAESLASSYASKLPSATTAKTTADEAVPTPKTTLKPDPTTAKTTTKEEESAPSTTSAADSGAEESTPAADETTATETLIIAPTSTGETSAGDSDSDDSDSGADTNPFGSPGGSAGTAVRPFFSLLGLSLAVGMLVLR